MCKEDLKREITECACFSTNEQFALYTVCSISVYLQSKAYISILLAVLHVITLDNL